MGQVAGVLDLGASGFLGRFCVFTRTLTVRSPSCSALAIAQTYTMAARHFSLGDAILHTANTSAHVPDAWRLALLRQLDSHSCAAVAQTCKAGLNCLLQEREDATLRVTGRKPKELPAHSLLRWTQAARGQLALRGSKATTLELTQCSSLRREDTWWQTVLGHLCAGVSSYDAS